MLNLSNALRSPDLTIKEKNAEVFAQQQGKLVVVMKNKT
jgi:hypothetical protein